jgi:hypothetical protein
MAALATVEDVEALGVTPGSVTDEMLEQASARFRSEASHNIEATEYVQVLRPAGSLVKIPRTPVVSVDAVHMLALDGTAGAQVVGWGFDGIDLIDLQGLAGDVWLNGPARWCTNVQVTYTAGYDPIPEDVRWAVAAMVKRAVEAGTAGVVSEAIGDYSRSFGGYTASGAFSMTADERTVARRYRPRVTSIPTRLA